MLTAIHCLLSLLTRTVQ